MNLVFVFSDEQHSMNCSLYNCIFVANTINKLYPDKHHAELFHISEFNQHTEKVQQACEKADLIIIERNLFGDALVSMMYHWVRDAKIAVIFDDSYDKMEMENVAYPFWKKAQIIAKNEKGEKFPVQVSPKPLTQLRKGMRIARGFIAPSEVLCNDWKPYTNVFRIHNYLNMDRYPKNTQPLFPHEGIVIGWCGSLSHVSSFTESGALEALVKVAKKYDNVKILIGGEPRTYEKLKLPGRSLQEYADKIQNSSQHEVREWYNKNFEEDKKIFSPFVPDEQWASLLKSIDIGLAPLSSEFDKRRSWIKALEYMIMKVPWIATNFKTYEELGEYGTLVNNTVDDWEKAICDVIENPAPYRKKMNKGYDFALRQSYDKNIDKLLAIYEQIINTPDRDDVQCKP